MKRAQTCLVMLATAAACRGGAPTLSPAPRLEQVAPVTRGRASWTSDRAEFAVGDVILVVIDEQTVAEANTANHASTSRQTNLTTQLAAALKGNSIGDANVGLGTQRTGDQARSGDATRSNRFSSELSVRVLGFSATGQMYVRGQKIVFIDNHQQAIQLSGWVRMSDVSLQNTVASSRIGDAELIYAGNGSLDQTPAGLLTRVLGAVAP